MLLGQKQAPNPAHFFRRNVGIPYRSLRGQQAAKSAYGGAGVGCWNKRMLRCNGADTGLNVTRHESEPTSDRWCVAVKVWRTVSVGGMQMDAVTRACAPPALSKDMYNGCRRVSGRLLGELSEFPGQ